MNYLGKFALHEFGCVRAIWQGQYGPSIRHSR
jgi:hypothetical protein